MAGKAPSPDVLASAPREKLDPHRHPYCDFGWCSIPGRASPRQESLLCPKKVLDRGYRAHCARPDGTKHGPAKGWSKYGELIIALTYHDGHEHGVLTTWYSGGQKESQIEWQQGKSHGPYTTWHRNGRVRARGQTHRGVKSGIWTYYHEEGRIKEQGILYRGGKFGPWVTWAEDGKPRSILLWLDGKAHLPLPPWPMRPAAPPMRTLSREGALPRETIQKVVTAHMHKIQGCYESALLTNRNLDGRLVLEWTVEPTGRATHASVVEANDEFRATNVPACIAGEIEKMRFPGFDGHAFLVRYPFVFRVQSF